MEAALRLSRRRPTNRLAKRCHVVGARFTPDELEALAREAGARGLYVTTCAAVLVCEALATRQAKDEGLR